MLLKKEKTVYRSAYGTFSVIPILPVVFCFFFYSKIEQFLFVAVLHPLPRTHIINKLIAEISTSHSEFCNLKLYFLLFLNCATKI